MRADEWKSEIGICSRERITSSSGLPFNRLYFFSLYCLSLLVFFLSHVHRTTSFSKLIFLCLIYIFSSTWSCTLKLVRVHLFTCRLVAACCRLSFCFILVRHFFLAQSFIKCDHFVCLFLSSTHLLHPKHKVAWLRVEDKGILTIHDHVITRNYRINLIHAEEKQFTLLIKNIQPSDAGGYMCQVSVYILSSKRA